MYESDTEVRPVARDRWVQIMKSLSGSTETTALRRRAPRIVVDEGQITLVFNEPGAAGAPPVVRAVALLDVSADGVRVRTHKPISIGTGVGMQVNVSRSRFVLLGRVVHSTPTPDGHHVGIEIVFDSAP